MSTRCELLIVSKYGNEVDILYKHHDGYINNGWGSVFYNIFKKNNNKEKYYKELSKVLNNDYENSKSRYPDSNIRKDFDFKHYENIYVSYIKNILKLHNHSDIEYLYVADYQNNKFYCFKEDFEDEYKESNFRIDNDDFYKFREVNMEVEPLENKYI